MPTLDRPAVWANPHDVHDWTSLALAKLAAAHLRVHPESIAIARERAVRWLSRYNGAPGREISKREWIDIIDSRSPEEIADLLESETQEATRLRSSMPFIREPFFTDEQRLTIIERAHA